MSSVSCSYFGTTAIISWCHIYYITSVILHIFSGCVTANEYYVSEAPNGVPCPTTDLLCHNLSYYVADYHSYFTDNVIFYFLEGTHTLQGILEITNLNNITLQGVGHIEQGFHETVMQSTSVIMCSDNNRAAGIKFITSKNIVMKSLTIANCVFDAYIYDQEVYNSLHFVDVNDVTLEWVSVQNSSDYGLCLVNNFDVLIANSSFTNNGHAETFGGNVYIYYDDQLKSLSRVNIVQSNFTLSLGYGIFLFYDSKVKVTIENSEFSYNIGRNGVFIDSYGNGSIEFRSCTIYNNTAKIYGGGVDIDLHGNGRIEFHNCTIYSNNAEYAAGGVNIYLENGSIKFQNCNISSNTAQKYGGGIFINSCGNGSIDFSDCTIYNNTVHTGGGGGVLIESFGNGSIDFCNCTIYINTAQKNGGGIYIYSKGSCGFKFSNCIIHNNTAYLGSGLLLYAQHFTSTASFHFRNLSFYFNKVPNKNDVYQGAVVLFNIHDIVFEQIEVNNHNTNGLVNFNSVITFDKNSTFVNNSGIYGGGIALYESSQLLLKNLTYISFVNNHASESGGGIFVSQLLVEDIYTTCSFQVICDNCSAWLYFVNNTANISGDVLYGGKIDNCNFDDLFHYHQQRGLSVVSSDSIQVCFCVADKPNCTTPNKNVTAMPGIDVNISLATVGSKDGLTKGVIKLTSSDNSSIVLVDNNRLNATCTNITFKLTANPDLLNATVIYATLENSIIGPLQDHQAKVINVTIESCPIGLLLVNDTCVCRSELNTPPISCDINTQIITRDGDMWIGFKSNSDCLIVYQNCPFDYCNDNIIHFKLTSPNVQCLYNRSGLLCGQCTEGLSLMIGSNKCGQCTNGYLALIIPFAVAGIALVAFVIVLNLTVSVGTINGLIFYANVLKLYEHFFFPNGRIPFLSHFISWLNLDLGIETCFYNGMSSCYKTWLQFIFPGYVWFLVILIIILSKYSSKVVQLVGRQAIPVLATMILLSYTKLIRTVFQVLHYTNIQCRDENNVTLLRWYTDANVQYLKGCHLSLFLFSLGVLILLIVPYTFYLLAIPLFEGPLSKYTCHCQKYMKPFFDAYGGPYKDKCRFWTGFLLFVRIVLALVVSLDTKATVSLYVLTSILFVIVSMYFPLRGIYQKLPLACLEMSFILNLIFIAYLNACTQTCEMSVSSQVLSVAMVSVSCVVFCSIILYHVWDRLLNSYFLQLYMRVKKMFKKPEPLFNSDDTEIALMCPGSPSIVCEPSSMSVVSVEMRHELILFDEDD